MLEEILEEDDLAGLQALAARDRGRLASVGPGGESALHVCAAVGAEKCAAWLLDQGSPVDARDALDRTPLHVAAEQGQLGMAKLLVARGAALEATSQGRTPLDLTGESREEEAALVAAFLRRAGARESLSSAVSSGKEKQVQKILEAGGRDWGAAATAALCIAVGAASIHSVGRHWPRVREKAEPRYQLNLRIVQLLLAHGADPNGPLPPGALPPLSEAAQGKGTELAELLLARGADPTRRDAVGRLPYEQAQNDPEIRALLKDAYDRATSRR
ncbi:ankyrin repeat domain-containing protein [Sandaracinus amylolyticus]|uniref:ankyrin repeat domain-containing protein n=1 Tax=Sandaracinus amylolyticus TaxID=927083 RepID=UPI001F472348|nr:ankyrin repeat domain-containing protein [Sandaracinus amylolyticus]UJR79012.1 Hypothetical protein I5071_10450 [Sandaracinus amylolyticus]